MPTRYFHHGDELGLKTRVAKGEAWIDDSGLNINGSTGTIVIAIADLQKADLFRLHGLPRDSGRTSGRSAVSGSRSLHDWTVRHCQFFGTGELHKALAGLVKSS